MNSTRRGPQQSAHCDLRVKVILLGDAGCGKSALMLRFAEDVFSLSYLTTIGVDFKIKKMDRNGRPIKMQIWDSAGQERFRAVTMNFCRGAQGIMLVYDVTNEKSFQSVRHWMRQIEISASPGINLMLVGNKCDQLEKKVISTSQGQALADEFGLPFLETSAKECINVDHAFQDMADSILARLDKADQAKGLVTGRIVLEPNKTPPPRSSCSCT
eukprot:CAMPEP_0181345538 /NCGR_PEP_ID=MMETSP1101-20121128/32803_1 /TAXON_ID=46948 /ORGANISM="Rhodomonas abbreviata, Strain Caron Lab Isolate" /LENGTH=213 /DNA_ID=CAMNT_0023457501 /DNA_START=22 /DNA_END=663 /DNA_ORIENTATION=+